MLTDAQRRALEKFKDLGTIAYYRTIGNFDSGGWEYGVRRQTASTLLRRGFIEIRLETQFGGLYQITPAGRKALEDGK